MQCEKEIGPVDAPDVTAFSEQRNDVTDIIDFQQERIVAAIFGRLCDRSGSGIARDSGGAALWRQKSDGEGPMGYRVADRFAKLISARRMLVFTYRVTSRVVGCTGNRPALVQLQSSHRNRCCGAATGSPESPPILDFSPLLILFLP